VASSEGSRSVTALRRDDDPVYGSLAAIDAKPSGCGGADVRKALSLDERRGLKRGAGNEQRRDENERAK